MQSKSARSVQPCDPKLLPSRKMNLQKIPDFSLPHHRDQPRFLMN